MRLIASLIAVCALGVPLRAQEPSLEDWQLARHEWTGEIADGRGVEIVNVYGDVRVRGGAEREIYLLANYQHHEDDPRRPVFAVDERAGRMLLEIRYPEVEVPEVAEIPDSWRKRRVDITVFVPAAADTKVTTTAGLAEVRGLRGQVVVSTEKGDIRVRIAGSLVAKTVHGEVLAQFRRTDWQTPSRIETLTGDMRVELPRGGEADVRIATRGEITTDYSLEIRRSEGSQLKQGVARIGEAGGKLVLESNRGAIKLIESLVPEESE